MLFVRSADRSVDAPFSCTQSRGRQEADGATVVETAAHRFPTLDKGVYLLSHRLAPIPGDAAESMRADVDACRVRTGYAPQNLAAIRNAALTLLNRIDRSNKAATLRRHAAMPPATVRR